MTEDSPYFTSSKRRLPLFEYLKFPLLYMLASRKSIRRFIELWIGVEDPVECYHQTLTFPVIEKDYRRAKWTLMRLLDNIHHRFEMASLFIVGRHNNGGYHFHVLFLFYRPVLNEESSRLEEAIWQAWQGLAEGPLNRRANVFKKGTDVFQDRFRTIDYFTKEIMDFPLYWWGNRNRTLLKKNSRPVTTREVSDIFNRLPFSSLFESESKRRKRKISFPEKIDPDLF